jgi:acetolactate synthase-1/2/3 large subunit
VAVDEKVPIKVAILNNSYLGMVRQWQEVFYNKRYSQTSFIGTKTDFVKLAEAFGAEGIKVTRNEEVEDAIKDALSSRNPVVIDFHVSKEENVSPMVPPGGRIDQMLDLAG